MTENILLIVIDTARADIVQKMMEKGQLPALKSISDSGITFSNAISNSPWTLPSHASLFTGQRPSNHGAHAGNKRFEPNSQSIAEHLTKSGYDTYGISGNIWISPEFGFDRGFDNLSMKYDWFWSGKDLSGVSEKDSTTGKLKELMRIMDAKTFFPTLTNGIYNRLLAGKYDKGANNTTRRTIKWLRSRIDNRTPFFFFINYLEPHLEYNPQKNYAELYLPDDVSYGYAKEIPQDAWSFVAGQLEYTEKEFEILRALYKAEIKYIDDQIKRILDELENQELANETTIIIVGDHGENIGEHNLMDHQYSLYQTLIHVPLFISGPRVAAKKVSSLVETRDVFPTILELTETNHPNKESVSKNSLLEDPERSVAISEYLAPQPSLDSLQEQIAGPIQTGRELDQTYRAIQDGKWKLIEGSNGDIELFETDSDPDETENLKDSQEIIVDKMQKELDNRGILLNYQRSDNFKASDESRGRLRDLGYL